MKKLILTTLTALFIVCTGLAQDKGFVRGNIQDGEMGEPMIGVTITIPAQPGVGTITDFDGNYSLPLAPGIYTVQYSFISFATQKFTEVEVKAGEVTSIDVSMKTSAEQLQAVEVTAKIRRNSEVAMLMDMKNATTVTDGLSAQTFRKLGDSDLSGAMKRVTGVTVQNGKYVYVRGLGDRYTKTTLNGMSLPGLDPDVNSIQMDIFPTAILENVSVAKTFSPELYGDFAGGQVDVVTKDFPAEKSTRVQVGATYIPGMHFNPDYILYDRAGSSVTGLDLGNRDIPFNPYRNKNTPDPVENDQDLENLTKSLDPQLGVKSKFAAPNMSFQVNHGNQINRKLGTFGYNAVLNYSNETAFYQQYESNNFLKSTKLDENELVPQVQRIGDQGRNNVNWSGLLSGAFKREKSTISALFLRSQNAETTATKRVNQDVEQNQATLIEDILTYSEKSLNTFQLNGEHRLGNVELNWGYMFAASRVYDPDFRETRIFVSESDTNLSTGNGSGIFRFWRELDEYNNGLRVDFKIPVSEKGFIKTGVNAAYKIRDFNTFAYKVTRENISDVSIDPDWYLQEDNIYSANADDPNNNDGTYLIGSYIPSNQYEARQLTPTGYIMASHNVVDKLRATYGVRAELNQMFYTGEDQGGYKLQDTMTLSELNILPSVNLTYELSDKMNLRAGVNQTVARPSFKEKSNAQIYDPITKRNFVGNINLEQTSIWNYDLRYEYFISGKELFAVGAFYKQFDGHIELVGDFTAPDNLTPRNSGIAETYGIEMELRKGLPKTESKLLKNLFLSTNFTLIQSKVDMQDVRVDFFSEQTEYELREANLRDGESLNRYRAMTGQSPYAVNAAISYEDQERRNSISLAYNVQGDQLTILASGRVPDVYAVAFHSLNINAYRNFGKDMRSRLTVQLNNILDEGRTLVYRSHGAEDQTFTTFKPGRGIGVKYSFTF